MPFSIGSDIILRKANEIDESCIPIVTYNSDINVAK